MNQVVEFDLSDVISKGRVIKNGPGYVTVQLLGSLQGPVLHFQWDHADKDFNILEQAYLLHMERYQPE